MRLINHDRMHTEQSMEWDKCEGQEDHTKNEFYND